MKKIEIIVSCLKFQPIGQNDPVTLLRGAHFAAANIDETILTTMVKNKLVKIIGEDEKAKRKPKMVEEQIEVPLTQVTDVEIVSDSGTEEIASEF